MLVQINDRISQKLVIVVLLLFGLVASGRGQTSQDSDVEAPAAVPQEEIIVYGDKSLRTLRFEMYDAQEKFFSVFNALNSDDDLNIECGFMQPLSVRRKYRVCAPKFSERAQAAASAEFALGMTLASFQRRAQNYNALSSSAFPHDAVARRKEKKMWQELETLLAENPEMQEALTELAKSRQIYESAKQRD